MHAQSRIDLAPRACRTLASITTARFVAATHALEVLTHESEHLAGADGIDDEARTDCYAAQRLALTARLLGRPAAEASTMGRFYLAFGQPGLPSQYRSRECRNGGRFDLRPNDDVANVSTISGSKTQTVVLGPGSERDAAEWWRPLGLVVLLGLFAVPVTYLVLWRTAFGLRLRACGENPVAAE